MRKVLSSFVFIFALLLGVPAIAATTIWSIYFETPWMPCGSNVLLTESPQSNPYQPGIRPCSDYQPAYPWDQCQPITIVGWDIFHWVENQNAWTKAFIGSGHGGDGADHFGLTGGQGNTKAHGMFPPGTGIKQGAHGPGNPTDDHIDIYGSCTGVENPGDFVGIRNRQRMTVIIYYTSP